MAAPRGKVTVVLNLDGKLVLRAKLVALRRGAQQGRTVTLDELVEAGLRTELRGEADDRGRNRRPTP